METKSNNFIPELWSREVIATFKQQLRVSSRSYGDRLLRAAARGEDWTNIKREESLHESFTNDAADALAYQLDRNVLAIAAKRGSAGE